MAQSRHVPEIQLPASLRNLAERLRSDPSASVWLPHPLVRALRRPALYWCATAALTALTLYIVSDLSSDARATLDAYGQTERVLVVTSPVGPGESLDSTSTEWRQVPRGLVPAEAVRVAPTEAVARVELFPGEVVVGPRLAGGGSGIAALLPPGTTALAMPPGASLPPVVVGDLVDVLASFVLTFEEGSDPSFRVAERASIVHVGEDTVTVAVAEEDAPAVAYALAHGVVTLAIVG